MILPSILEYDVANLRRKLQYLSQNFPTPAFQTMVNTGETVSETTNLTPPLALHLDFVLPQFAKDRGGILASLGTMAVLSELQAVFSLTKLDLSVHLMGELEDLSLAWEFWDKFRQPRSWSISLYVPPNQFLAWKVQFSHLKVGIWLDLPQWYPAPVIDLDQLFELCSRFLILTVVAGKSGQKLEPIVRINLQTLINNHFQHTFIVDGGWDQAKGIEFQKHTSTTNIDFVSYSGFWSKTNLI